MTVQTQSSPMQSTPSKKEAGVSFSQKLKILVIVGVAVCIGGVLSFTLAPQMAGVATLTVLCIGFWATGVVPEFWTAFVFFLVAMVTELAPAETIFSGFHSSTFWLLFSGIVLGAAIRHTGLGKRTATILAKALGGRYSGVIIGTTLFSLALAFILPSSVGRIVMLVPILISLADHMGYGPASKGRTGLLSAAVLGTNIPAFSILPANAPNMIMAGMAENLFGYQVAYWDYLLIHFPVLGVLKAFCLILLILWMFPDHAPNQTANTEVKTAPLSGKEWKLILILGLCLVFWISDGIHGVSPGWVALAAALYCLWPDSHLTSKNCINDDINYASLFFVAGIIGLGALISVSGLGEAVFTGVSQFANFSEGQPLQNIAVLTGISTLVAIVASLPSVPAIMTPMAQDIAELTGLPLSTILMTQVLAFSNVFLPYQAPPLIIAMQLGKIPFGALAKLCLALFALSIIVLMPLDLIWWQFIGMI